MSDLISRQDAFDTKHKKKCRTCVYRTKINGSLACQYILIEKERRPCPASECTVYRRGKQIKSKAQEAFLRTI